MSPRRHSADLRGRRRDLGIKRFIMLGLVDERPDGFAITELGRQRLDAEHKAESANRSRSPLFRQ